MSEATYQRITERIDEPGAMPNRGVNALDGLLSTFQAISNLHQHIRATNEEELTKLKPRVQACFDAGNMDMDNVSYRVPSIHPMLVVAPLNVVIHNPEFEQLAGSAHGDAAAIDGAKALALTAAAFLLSPGLQEEVKRAYQVSKGLC